jgi:hypothetical protein
MTFFGVCSEATGVLPHLRKSIPLLIAVLQIVQISDQSQW